MKKQRKRKHNQHQLVERSLAAFIRAGTIDVSLDQLAKRVGISKRMLVHYFGGRENIEEKTMTLLEERLRAQFSPEAFPPDVPPGPGLAPRWEKKIYFDFVCFLFFVLGLSRREWSASARAKAFYAE